MPRFAKQGLDYYPNDVDIHDDDKIALISSEFSAIGEAILWRLFCRIYKNGYYYSWGGDERLLFCRWSGGIFVPNQIDEVIKGCLRRSVFDERVFKMFGVLTSRGIQKRYLQATQERKEIEIIEDYWLLELPENSRFRINRSINDINPPIYDENPPIGTQSKVKKSKVEESNTLSQKCDLYKESFERFRKLYPGTKRGLDVEYLNFVKKNKPEIADLLISALEVEINHRNSLSLQRVFVPPWKNLSTWINQKCWTQEFPEITTRDSNKDTQGLTYSEMCARCTPTFTSENFESKKVGAETRWFLKQPIIQLT